MKLLRALLLPLVPIYWLVTWFRNFLFDINLLPSKAYEFPVICVGNLSVGGTGKTPMVEFLIRLLGKKYKIATLSRGYKRSSKGFKLANEHTTVGELGDEPFQFYKKFPNINVAVDADRVAGIAQLQRKVSPQIILLDDAFQHRKVSAGFNVLLTSYHKLFYNDITLPTGDLREPRKGVKRASAVVVTKCPKDISEQKRTEIKNKIEAYTKKPVFFSYVDYAMSVQNLVSELNFNEFLKKPFVLVTGIANPMPLVSYLTSKNAQFEHKGYLDHHSFSQNEIRELKNLERPILTTEKDFWRLASQFDDQDALYYVPIEMRLFNEGGFNELITNYVSNTLS